MFPSVKDNQRVPMSDYNLSPNEFVILQGDSIRLVVGSETQHLKEVVLTNLNLILVRTVQRGFFNTETLIKRCPLDELQTVDGLPQAVVSKIKEDWWLQVPFKDDVIKLKFSAEQKRLANHWVNAIRCAAMGDLSSIDTSFDPASNAWVYAIEDTKEALGSIFGLRPTAKETTKAGVPQKKPEKVTQKCIGCHAPLTGKRGSVITCPYCDTKQTL